MQAVRGREARARTRSFCSTTSTSASALSADTALAATPRRRAPSKPNGAVTTATTTAPHSLATRATTGAAPEPVPPPSLCARGEVASQMMPRAGGAEASGSGAEAGGGPGRAPGRHEDEVAALQLGP